MTNLSRQIQLIKNLFKAREDLFAVLLEKGVIVLKGLVVEMLV
jgi:hypothetical protein